MVYKVVLTGGPGSGKTSVKDGIIKNFVPQGYQVFFVPETATELINGGIKCFGDDAVSLVDFQEYVMRLQLLKEEIYLKAASKSSKDVIIVYDRGSIDNFAYMNNEQGNEVINRIDSNLNKSLLMEQYDLVVVLVGRKDFYTTLNNEARSEDADTALALGEKTLNTWVGHSKIKIVGPKDDKNQKVNEVLNIINELLSKEKVRKQEKYLVSLKDSDLSSIKENGKLQFILQTYLISEPNIEKRLRKVFFDGVISYYYSIFKINDKGEKVVISEKSISEDIYNSLLDFKDNSLNEIRKTRYYFTYKEQYFNLDLFDINDEYGMLEVNTSNEVVLPEYLDVLERVTSNKQFYNKYIAKKAEGKKMELI